MIGLLSVFSGWNINKSIVLTKREDEAIVWGCQLELGQAEVRITIDSQNKRNRFRCIVKEQNDLKATYDYFNNSPFENVEGKQDVRVNALKKIIGSFQIHDTIEIRPDEKFIDISCELWKDIEDITIRRKCTKD